MPAKNEHHVQMDMALWSTLAAALLPGAGHLLLRRTRHAALLLAVMGAGLALAVLHLTRGLELFESPLGTFLFPVLLRGLAILHAFSVLDAYLVAVDPRGTVPPRRRQAVVLNLLVPGVGYLLARSWLRAATGLALLALVLVFARLSRHPYLDLIFIGMQGIMAVAVYQQMRLRFPAPASASLAKAPAAQVIVLLAITVAVTAFGYVLQRALPGPLSRLAANDIHSETRGDDIYFSVPRLGLSMTAAGPGWTAASTPGYLFAAEHHTGGAGDATSFALGGYPIPPFARMERVVSRVQRQMQDKGLAHRKSTELTIGGKPALQMRFSAGAADHWTILVPAPRQKLAYVIQLQCVSSRCQQLLPQLERTRDSLRLE